LDKIKSKKINYAVPGPAMSQQEFEQMIKEAEKGPFHTVEQVEAEMAKWIAKHSK